MSRKLLLIGFLLGIISTLQLSYCATSSSDKQQFTASIPYHEQLLPAEDNRATAAIAGVSAGQQQQNSYRGLGNGYQDGALSSSGSGDIYSSSGVQANSVNSFGSSSAPAADTSYRTNGGGGYQSSISSFDSPTFQDSYATAAAPKPNSGYGPAPKPSYGPAKQAAPSSSYGQPIGDSHAYYYQHYPIAQGGYGGGGDHHHSDGGGGGKGGLFSGLSGFGGLGSLGDLFNFDGFGGGAGGYGGGVGGEGEGGIGVAGGVGALKAIVIAIKAIKGIVKFKSFFVLGLLFLLALPLVLLFFPIPVISIIPNPDTTTPAPGGIGRAATGYRSSGYRLEDQQSIGRQLLLSLTDKVLNAEECLERMICKLPQIPNKSYQRRARSLWVEYGTKFVTNSRVQRGVEAYFDEDEDEIVNITEESKLKKHQQAKNRTFKCNQKFKCSNKFF